MVELDNSHSLRPLTPKQLQGIMIGTLSHLAYSLFTLAWEVFLRFQNLGLFLLHLWAVAFQPLFWLGENWLIKRRGS